MKNKIELLINEKYQGLSIKEFLKCNHVGRGKIEEIRTSKSSFINGEYASLDYILKLNDSLSFISEEVSVKPISSSIKILYEDDFFIAVDKPSFLLVHGDGNENETLINYAAYYLITHHKLSILYPLHRIDFETSGVVIFAKNFLSCAYFSHLIEKHKVIKEYLLLCKGHLNKNKGEIKLFLGKDRHNANKMVVLKNNGLLALSQYEVIKKYKGCSKVKVKILTGRKHQIRVSFAHVNHPLLGDKLYGEKNDMMNLQLIAYSLTFDQPFINKKVEIKSTFKLEENSI